MSADTRGIRERVDEWVKENYMKLPGSGGEVIKEAMARFAESELAARELPSHEDIIKVLGNGWNGFKLNDLDDLNFVIGQIRLAIMKCDALGRARQEGS